MNRLNHLVDPNGLHEYSVVYTDRSLNHMSQQFQQSMKYLSGTLCDVYKAKSAILVPGGGSYGMESVARQFANQQKCLVIRNGWFSYRWTQIIEACQLTDDVQVLKAQFASKDKHAPLAPVPIEQVVETIKQQKPKVVFAPHVETSSGIILPNSYIRAIGEAVRAVGGLFVLDCIASGAVWVDMQQNLVDVLISAPQKGWSSTPCCGIVMLGERAKEHLPNTQSNSFAMDLAKWQQIMQAYLDGGHAYHATMPTDGIQQFAETMHEMEQIGWQTLCDNQWQLGELTEKTLFDYGYPRLAANGFKAPGVVVCYTDDPLVHNGAKFVKLGYQIAAGVPLMCDEPESYQTFRIGLFGLDKLMDVQQTVATLATALQKL